MFGGFFLTGTGLRAGQSENKKDEREQPHDRRKKAGKHDALGTRLTHQLNAGKLQHRVFADPIQEIQQKKDERRNKKEKVKRVREFHFFPASSFCGIVFSTISFNSIVMRSAAVRGGMYLANFARSEFS